MRAGRVACFIGMAFFAMACSKEGGESGSAATAPPPAAEAMASVTGTVAYRQRIALPPGAVVTVRLEDISLADVKAKLLAEQVIESSSQVPIPFELNYDPSAVDPRHRYAVRAQIRVEDELWFTTTRVNPVLNDAGAGPVELVLDMVRR